MTITDPSATLELQHMAARPFENAVAMPRSVYPSKEFLARERDRSDDIRARSNVCLHRMSTLLKGAGNTCTEAVYRGLCAGLSKPGHLSHLARPIYDFAQYLASRTE